MPKLWPDQPEQTATMRVRKWWGGQMAELKAVLGGVMHFATSGGTGWWYTGQRDLPDYTALVGDGADTSIVTPVVRWIGRNVNAPVKVRRTVGAGEQETVLRHPMIELIESPNAYYDGRTLIQATAADLSIDGNAYWIIERSGAERPARLWWTPHTMIEPKWNDRDDTVFITHYEYRPGGGRVYEIPPEDVIHFRDGIDPLNTRKGRSALKSVIREIYTDEEAARFSAAILVNMGVPGTVIAPVGDRTMTVETAEAAKTRFDETTKGAQRGGTIVFGQAVDIHAFGFSPEQLNLRNMRRIPEERVSAAFGVPAIVAGLGAGLDRSTFANYAEAREAGYEECIIPMQGVITSALKRQLLVEYLDSVDGFDVYFDLSDVRILQEDEAALSARTVAELNGTVIMLSEARRALGYEATEADDVYLVPVGKTFVPAAELVTPADQPPTPAPEPTPAQIGT